MADLHEDVINQLSSSDGFLVEEAVRDIEKRDLKAMVQDCNRFLQFGMHQELVGTQFQIITAMAKVIVHLKKQNAMMDQDYRGRNR